MPKTLAPAFLAGIASGILFLIVAAAGLGFFFMFLPTLPLFYLGLGYNPRAALPATVVAATLVSLITGLPLGLLFFISLALPAWYFAKEALLSRPREQLQEWFPVGRIIAELTLYAAVLVVAVALFYSAQGEKITELLAAHIRHEFADLQGEYGEAIEAFATQWSFLIFSITIWLWGLALYAHAWMAQRLLSKNAGQVRPDVAVLPFTLPNWMLTLLAIVGLASLIGGETLSFLGKSLLVSLLLPYFFSGCALMHEASKTWPSRRFFLFFVYLMIAAQFWPALILALIGLFHHVKGLNKHLSGGGTSSSN